ADNIRAHLHTIRYSYAIMLPNTPRYHDFPYTTLFRSGFKREAKNLTSHKAPIFVKEKGKAPMASNAKKNHAFMYYDRRNARNARSEEHTSELQSRFDLVCRLLLEQNTSKAAKMVKKHR